MEPVRTERITGSRKVPRRSGGGVEIFIRKGRTMRIGELARRTETATSRIRFYEKKGLLPPAERRENGYRDFPEHTVEQVKIIILAQHLGFTLAEIRHYLASDSQGLTGSDDVITRLRDKVEAVDRDMRGLASLRTRLTRMIEHITTQKESGECSEIDDLRKMASPSPEVDGEPR